LSCHSFPSGIATAPVEVIETTSPLVIRRKELRPDSGGPGRFRGGLGQSIEVEVATGEPFIVSSLSDRMKFAAQGYLGGKPGARGGFKTSRGARPNIKLSQRFPPGTSFTLDLPGGAGFYDPLGRDPAAVARDVSEGLVSSRSAEADYGVRITRSGRIVAVTPGRRQADRRARQARARQGKAPNFRPSRGSP
jgi:N-methylhydantoinase B/oxoprolinase/acetone carboxylase alpha subunit